MSHLLALLLLNPIAVQEKAPIGTRAVDYVSVRNQQPLFGVVLEHAARKPALVAVQRGWLRKDQPEAYKTYRKQELDRARHQGQILIERLKQWIEERKDEEFLVKYLKEQLTKLRAEARAEKPREPTSQFMIVKIEAKQVRRVRRAGVERRKPLFLAYRERLKDIEIRSAENLTKELIDKGNLMPKEPVNLSDRIPSTGDNIAQWSARQAIIEQLYRTKPIKMAGTPRQIFQETTDGKPADVMEIAAKMMVPNADDIVGRLTESARFGQARTGARQWKTQAINEAKAQQRRAVFVKLVHPDLTLKEALVEAYLLARMPDGSWRTVWMSSHSVKPDLRPEIEKQLREDEQIRGILDMVKGLGNEEAVTKAVRFGAATKVANRQVEDEYVKWRDKFFDDLREPAIAFPGERK